MVDIFGKLKYRNMISVHIPDRRDVMNAEEGNIQTRMDENEAGRGPTFKDLSGKVFDKLTVIRPLETTPHGTLYECRCTCGRTCNKWGYSLTGGRVRSCGASGCRTRRSRAPEKKEPRVAPEDVRIYRFWCELMEVYNRKMWRCRADGSYYPILTVYGGFAWDGFLRWSHSDGGYSDRKILCSLNGYNTLAPFNINEPDGPRGMPVHPKSVEWCYEDQAIEEDRLLIIKPAKVKYYRDPSNGHVYTRVELAERYGMTLATLNSRLNRGWTMEDACLTPVRGGDDEEIE